MFSFRKMLCCLTLIASVQSALAQKSSPIRKEQALLEDPIFGISYSPSQARYEEAPLLLKKRCRLGNDPIWIYAHVRKDDSDYFIVTGYQLPEYEPEGSSLWVEGAECRDDLSAWTLSGLPPTGGYQNAQSSAGLPGLGAAKVCENRPEEQFCRYILRSPAEEALLRDLVQDGLQRAIKAWGKAPFRKKQCSAEAISKQSDYPIVQQELRKFCSTPD